MATKTLIQYGNRCITNPYFNVTSLNMDRSYTADIQRLNNARSEGSTPVNKTISEKVIDLKGWIKESTNRTLTEQIDELKAIFAKDSQYLRVIRDWGYIDTSSTPFTTNLTVVSKSRTGEPYWDITPLRWGTNILTLGSELTHTATLVLNDYDLQTPNTMHILSFAFYCEGGIIPYSVSMKIGKDSSNYYSGRTAFQADGSSLTQGWNFVSFPVADLTLTGTITSSTLGYFQIGFDRGTDGWGAGTSYFYYSGTIYSDETTTRNYLSMVQAFQTPDDHHNITVSPYDAQILAYEGVSESTIPTERITATGQTTNKYSTTLGLLGTYDPTPEILLYYNAATNVDYFTLFNKTTGQSVKVDTTFSAGDVIGISTKDKTVKKNNTNIAYTDVMPEFVLGENEVEITHVGTSPTTDSFTTNDTSFDSSTKSYQVGTFNPSTYTRLGQSYTPSVSGTLYSVDLYLKLISAGVGNIEVCCQIYSDSSTAPNTLLATSSYIPISRITSSLTYVTFSDINLDVTSGTKYWIVLQSRYINGSNIAYNYDIDWGANVAGGYTGGEFKYQTYSAGTYAWSNTSYATMDLNFKAYVQQALTIDYDVNISAKSRYL